VALKADSDEPDPNVTRVNPQFRPPLTKDLFNSNQAFSDILAKYPLATALSEEIRSMLRKSTGTAGKRREGILVSRTANAALEVISDPLHTFLIHWI
jgi:hypothetical protein